MTHKIKKLLRAAVFLLIFALLFQWATFVLRDKSQSVYMAGFQLEERDSLDVIFIGSSMMYRTVYPMELWDEYGIVSYNLGSSEQSLPTSTWLAQYAIEAQHPDLIVVDVGLCTGRQKINSEARLHQSMDDLPWTWTKLQCVLDLSSQPETFLFPIIQYHSRWETLTESDLLISEEEWEAWKGAGYYNQVQPQEPVETVTAEDAQPLDEVPLTYLLRLIELCEENQVDLLLVGMPTSKDAGVRQRLYYTVDSIAEEHQIDFLNFYELMEPLGLTWESSFSDKMHLHYDAAKQVTSYLGGYIMEHYDVPDRRSDPDYAAWYEASELYHASADQIVCS